VLPSNRQRKNTKHTRATCLEEQNMAELKGVQQYFSFSGTNFAQISKRSANLRKSAFCVCVLATAPLIKVLFFFLTLMYVKYVTPQDCDMWRIIQMVVHEY
jgi:hypothetical protein